jgi:hypothetical protein
METECSLQHSQQHATRPYPEPDRSSARRPPPPTPLFLKIHFSIILPFSPWSYKWFPSLRFLNQNNLCTSPLPCMLHALSISVILIWSPECYLMRNREHEAPRYVVFSNPLLPFFFQTRISSSTPYSRHLEPNFPPSSPLNISDEVSHP